ncbi:serine protease snk-like [Epargyreus clarus]|uniref:serine protease snk-like n=1 Tax=Epargyreus clarus TaxID=520877 RepID=UPI003C2CEF22
MEFERNRCEFMEDFKKKLVDVFKRPVVPGKIDRFGINARDVATGVYPHMGALGWLDTSNSWLFNCASALISPNFILTAAHCSWLSPKKYNLTDPKPQMVRLGNQNILERNSKDYLDVKIQEIIVHPAYKPPLKYSDIALMKLVEEVKFHAHIAPACLTRNPNVDVGDAVDSTGWEYKTAALKGDSSYILNFEISIIDSNVCDGMFKVVKDKNFKGIRSHQLCAGKINQGVDIYQEHSARFIQVTDARVCLFDVPLYTLIGVTAYGLGGAGAGVPSVYTRISSYVDWIEENVWKEELNL